MTPLAETGMVNVGMADGTYMYAAPVHGEGESGVEGGVQSGMICMISLLAQ